VPLVLMSDLIVKTDTAMRERADCPQSTSRVVRRAARSPRRLDVSLDLLARRHSTREYSEREVPDELIADVVTRGTAHADLLARSDDFSIVRVRRSGPPHRRTALMACQPDSWQMTPLPASSAVDADLVRYGTADVTLFLFAAAPRCTCAQDAHGYGDLLVRAGVLAYSFWLAGLTCGLSACMYGRTMASLCSYGREHLGGRNHVMTLSLGYEQD